MGRDMDMEELFSELDVIFDRQSGVFKKFLQIEEFFGIGGGGGSLKLNYRI